MTKDIVTSGVTFFCDICENTCPRPCSIDTTGCFNKGTNPRFCEAIEIHRKELSRQHRATVISELSLRVRGSGIPYVDIYNVVKFRIGTTPPTTETFLNGKKIEARTKRP